MLGSDLTVHWAIMLQYAEGHRGWRIPSRSRPPPSGASVVPCGNGDLVCMEPAPGGVCQSPHQQFAGSGTLRHRPGDRRRGGRLWGFLAVVPSIAPGRGLHRGRLFWCETAPGQLTRAVSVAGEGRVKSQEKIACNFSP